MDAEQFREFGYAAVDFIADYMENVHKKFVSRNKVAILITLKNYLS